MPSPQYSALGASCMTASRPHAISPTGTVATCDAMSIAAAVKTLDETSRERLRSFGQHHHQAARRRQDDGIPAVHPLCRSTGPTRVR